MKYETPAEHIDALKERIADLLERETKLRDELNERQRIDTTPRERGEGEGELEQDIQHKTTQ